MLIVTDKAAAVLKAAKSVQGAPLEARVRIVHGTRFEDSGKAVLTVGFTISEDPAPEDEELEQSGLRIFVEAALVQPLDGRTLDARDWDDGPEFIFR
jgi:Fe-S cluster assembly iron-binding protein IscA